jgi:hypothetical protein
VSERTRLPQRTGTVTKLAWLAGLTLISASALATRFGREVWAGMLAPLLVVIVTWVIIERVYRTAPERLTSVMMAAFAGKLIFFGAYVGVAIGVLRLELVPFAASFAGYFIALHAIEAVWMKRLFAQ